jgi:hypothetical protein
MKNTGRFIKLILFIIFVLLLGLGIYYFSTSKSKSPKTDLKIGQIISSTSTISTPSAATTTPIINKPNTSALNNPALSLPISGALARVTKKPFGIYVSPQNSPVSPEHFIGYHTGVDFETTPAEQNSDVAVYAICDGPLILKKIATGYGGVAVQACTINKEAVTIIYGHLRLTSVTAVLNKSLSKGEQIGFLGKGYSTETAGERKHLHLGIHRGSAVDLLGYVQNKNQLSGWINFISLIK